MSSGWTSHFIVDSTGHNGLVSLGRLLIPLSFCGSYLRSDTSGSRRFDIAQMPFGF